MATFHRAHQIQFLSVSVETAMKCIPWKWCSICEILPQFIPSWSETFSLPYAMQLYCSTMMHHGSMAHAVVSYLHLNESQKISGYSPLWRSRAHCTAVVRINGLGCAEETTWSQQNPIIKQTWINKQGLMWHVSGHSLTCFISWTC